MLKRKQDAEQDVEQDAEQDAEQNVEQDAEKNAEKDAEQVDSDPDDDAPLGNVQRELCHRRGNATSPQYHEEDTSESKGEISSQS